jgi:hypothetical protein
MSLPDTTLTVEAKHLATELECALTEGRQDVLAPETLQALLAAICKIYVAQIQMGRDFLPLSPQNGVTATEIMEMTSNLLRSGNLQTFELGMWQSGTGR